MKTIIRWWNQFMDWWWVAPKEYANPKLPRYKRGHLVFMVRTHRCGTCNGAGYHELDLEECEECDGTGFMNSQKHRSIYASPTETEEKR